MCLVPCLFRICSWDFLSGCKVTDHIFFLFKAMLCAICMNKMLSLAIVSFSVGTCTDIVLGLLFRTFGLLLLKTSGSLGWLQRLRWFTLALSLYFSAPFPNFFFSSSHVVFLPFLASFFVCSRDKYFFY